MAAVEERVSLVLRTLVLPSAAVLVVGVEELALVVAGERTIKEISTYYDHKKFAQVPRPTGVKLPKG